MTANDELLPCKIITAYNGVQVIVDADDYEYLSQYKWHIKVGGGGNSYACRSAGGKTIRMHREIMKATAGQEIDHINHNSLDNRKCNLRICTRSQNGMNKRPIKGNYKGVSFCNTRGRWFSQICSNNDRKTIGYYSSEVDAARAYDEYAQKLHGEFAFLNFPDTPFTQQKE
jgi:hypothetical protein